MLARALPVTLLLAAALSLSACGPPTFNAEVKGSSTLQGGDPLAGLLGTFPGVGSFTNIDFNSNQDFQNQGVTKDQVDSVKVDRVQLKITDPNDQDFRFLESIQFFAKAGDKEALIAERSDISSLGLVAPNPILELTVSGAELQPFVVAPQMSIIVRGKGKNPAKTTTMEATVNLKVSVKLF